MTATLTASAATYYQTSDSLEKNIFSLSLYLNPFWESHRQCNQMVELKVAQKVVAVVLYKKHIF